MMKNVELAKQLISLLDLTSLNDSDTDKTIETLCQKAVTPLGKVAAVCVYPVFVSQAKKLLQGTDIHIATVINFPDGKETVTDCVNEIKDVLKEGADEIDIVMPYEAYLQGDDSDVAEFLQACRGMMGPTLIMKVILETGALINPEMIEGATRLAIEAKANFIKTSTGKIKVGATLPAAKVILNTIKNAGKPVGFKASGGIRTVEDANRYLMLAKEIMGDDWVSVQTMRLGASSLLDDILH